MKLGWLVVLGLAAAGGYYWYKNHAVTQLTPGNKYTLTGVQGAPIFQAVQLLGVDATQVVLNTDGTATVTGTYSGPAVAVPAGLTAHNA